MTAEMTLEPYAVRLVLKSRDSKDSIEWGWIVSAFMEALARYCTAAGPTIIGHIKCFAQSPGSGFMKISVIDAKHKAEITGTINGQASELDVSLNVLVYGHTREKLEKITLETIAAAGKPWSGMVYMAEAIPSK